MIDLVNLRDHHCRYMVEGSFFCGQRAVLGKSWCKEHAKLVYTPSRPRGEGAVRRPHLGLLARPRATPL